MRGGLELTQLLFKVKVAQALGTETVLPHDNQPNPGQMNPPYRRYSLAYVIGVANIAFTESSDGNYRGAFEYGVRVYNADGDEVVNAAGTETHPILPPPVYQSMLRSGANAHLEIDVPAKGDYFLRILTALLLSGSVALAQTPDPCATAPQSCATLIETHATSQMQIPNSVVDVVVGITAAGKDLPTVQRSLADKSSSLITYLRAQQVQRLITNRVNFSPETKFDRSGLDKTVGYGGSSKVSFRTVPDKVADILAGVLTNGASSIDSTIFTPTEQEIVEARRSLSADATRTAESQAAAIAAAAGMKVVSIRSINVDSNSDVGPVQARQLEINGYMGDVKDEATTPVETASGDKMLSIRVNVVAAASH